MNFLERLGNLAQGMFDLRLEIQHTQQKQEQDRQVVRELANDLKALVASHQALTERVARLEANRDADRAEYRADQARFLSDMERVALRIERMQLNSPPPDKPS